MGGSRGRLLASGLSHAAVDVLHYLKARYDYRVLASITSISPSTLARYISGKTMPRIKNAKKILEKSPEIVNPRELVMEYFGPEPYIENGVYLSQDIQTVKLLASYTLSQFMGSRVNSTLALDLLAIPLATCFASLTGCNLYFISEKPIWRDGRYVEISYRVDSMASKERLWLPIEVIEGRQSVLIFSTRLFDLSPLREVLKLLERHKVFIAGVLTLVTKRKIWESLSTPPGCKRVAILEYE